MSEDTNEHKAVLYCDALMVGTWLEATSSFVLKRPWGLGLASAMAHSVHNPSPLAMIRGGDPDNQVAVFNRLRREGGKHLGRGRLRLKVVVKGKEEGGPEDGPKNIP